jgi:hypothetical protein
MIDALRKYNPKRIHVDEIGAAETRLSELKARAEAAEARRKATAERLAEGRKSLEEAAENGAELAPIARSVLEAETELKAIALEADPLAGAVRRAEEVLADLKEERRLALLDAALERVHAEGEKVKAEAAEAVKVLAALLDRAYGVDRLNDALFAERNGRTEPSSKSMYENGTWMTFLEDASGDRRLALAAADAGKTPPRWSLKLNLRLVDPQFAMRAVRAELLTEKP